MRNLEVVRPAHRPRDNRAFPFISPWRTLARYGHEVAISPQRRTNATGDGIVVGVDYAFGLALGGSDFVGFGHYLPSL
jgi:hypothetical protein